MLERILSVWQRVTYSRNAIPQICLWSEARWTKPQFVQLSQGILFAWTPESEYSPGSNLHAPCSRLQKPRECVGRPRPWRRGIRRRGGRRCRHCLVDALRHGRALSARHGGPRLEQRLSSGVRLRGAQHGRDVAARHRTRCRRRAHQPARAHRLNRARLVSRGVAVRQPASLARTIADRAIAPA